MDQQPDHDEIARCAYELYLARGEEDGRDLEDWLEAERQLAKAPRRRARKPVCSFSETPLDQVLTTALIAKAFPS